MATRKKHAQRSRYSYHTSGVPERMFTNHAMQMNNMKMLRNNNGIGARASAFFKGLLVGGVSRKELSLQMESDHKRRGKTNYQRKGR